MYGNPIPIPSNLIPDRPTYTCMYVCIAIVKKKIFINFIGLCL